MVLAGACASTRVDPAAYLARIGHPPVGAPDAAALVSLHRAHLLSVPFENLDIHRGRRIPLDERAFVRKVVEERRGGFCYELNGAFAWLLRALGYGVELMSATVARDDGSFGPEYDHMLLRARLPEGTFLADVGFGDSHLLPLRFALDVEQSDPTGRHRLVRDGARVLLDRERDGVWEPLFSFEPRPRALAEFAGLCQHHQTSPSSHFTQKRVVTLATPDGRITLRDDRLIETRGGARYETPLTPSQWEATLRERFGIGSGD